MKGAVEPLESTEMTYTNFEVALKAEMKKVTRCFHAHSSEARASHAASHRLGYQQRQSLGDFFYVHPDFPNVAFKTRSAAAKRALRETA